MQREEQRNMCKDPGVELRATQLCLQISYSSIQIQTESICFPLVLQTAKQIYLISYSQNSPNQNKFLFIIIIIFNFLTFGVYVCMCYVVCVCACIVYSQLWNIFRLMLFHICVQLT